MDGNVSDVFWVLCVKCLGFFKDFAMWEVGWFVSLQKFLMIDGKSFFVSPVFPIIKNNKIH